MKPRTLLGTLLCFLGCIFSAVDASADQVLLRNGDHITGTVFRMEYGILVMQVGYTDVHGLRPVQDNLNPLPEEDTLPSIERLRERTNEEKHQPNEIEIRWDAIACLQTDAALKVVLDDGQIFIGKIACIEDGKIVIKEEKVLESKAFGFDEIVAINPSPPPPEVTYKTIIDTAGSITGGNTHSKAAYLSTQFGIKSKRHWFQVSATYNYGETEGVMDTRKAWSTLHYSFFTSEKVYSYAQTLFESDDFQGLNLRTSEGVGIGYQFYDTSTKKFFVEGGISNLNEDYKNQDDNRSSSLRGSIGFEFWLLDKKLKLFHLDEMYYTLAEDHPYYAKTEQGFRIRMVGSFYANFQVDFTYNNSPDEGKKRIDTTYLFGMSYERDYR
jgi:putative salt-induced outer membrane protein YdiY